jgi:hypothetical protein
VLNHADLLEMNIHADLSTGGITRIVDWTGATAGPLGLSLWGFETILGVMSGTGWHFHPRHVELREIFWGAFYAAVGDLTDSQWEAIRVGRLVGLFQAYGFQGGVPVPEGDLSLACLEAYLSVER